MKKFNPFLLLFLIALVSTGCRNEKKSDEVSVSENQKSETTNMESKGLSDSPRHHEWVTLSYDDRNLEAFVVYPEKKDKAKPVILIHENRGLNDWARLFADKLAGEGYLVIAPDLISNTVEGKKKTTDFEDSDAAREAIYNLDKNQVTADLDAAFQYIKNDPASTGEVAVVGFCWGGSQTFRYATNNEKISSAHVFYGTGPEEASEIAEINAPIYGYYGGNDNRVNSTIEKTEKLMKNAGKTYEYKIYEDAGHAFMRSGHQQDAEPGNKKAHDQAWKRLLELLD
ncbi:dienelactone hydrolase family protein [Gramella sp. GC03-9]|uniref:Dienelactone hydrolase family protein n=1 Tax=Christiangramia oceanisediminis TaxID=2920386 RepID=A0A9X2I9V2_9FLAO|nr:dienelactone hydrolase family protein [Gramella oceanisediminis]MCP9200076.1 dienelactone hydrolase family protein [Gramella oceanisediminis]